MKKAGKLAIGEEPVGAACRARSAILVLTAENAAENTLRRAAHVAEGGKCPLLPLPLSKEDLGFALWRGACALLAVEDAGFAASLAEKLAAENADSPLHTEAAEKLKSMAARVNTRRREKRAHERNLAKGKSWQTRIPPRAKKT
jgi:ribosomal protein L7Ae-like RNA K-turn-binding protein